ncbi:MAG TPA: FAD-dependent oxidoreductase [Acidobacteriaceae bacterium]|nr:FAD-dependent oxidoreductase [Acidobacteriaceae bacterium]
MQKPILLTVDDDTSVLEALVQDLRRHYGSRYRILRAASGQAGLDASNELKRRGETVALLLSDQRMPGMSGVEFLEKSIEIFPAARRVLLTAYADTDAAIRAINAAKIHYYLTKPWDPPEERLYAVLDDLLESWKLDYRPSFEGIKVIGSRWLPAGHQIRDFLSRNHIPYRWLDPSLESNMESGPGSVIGGGADGESTKLMAEYHLDPSKLPVVLLPDGEALVQPRLNLLAEKAGLRVQAERDFYDLVIAGAGPAGLAAAVYGASEGLKTLVIEPSAPGGQAGSSSRIENYLGFPAGVSGADLARRAWVQATRFGAEFLSQRATGIRTDGQYHFIQLDGGNEVACHTVLISTGVDYRKLGPPNLERLSGAGVYYGAALSEAISCKDESVMIVGGANSAGQAAVHFARYSAKVTMLVRADSLEKSMSSYLIHQIRGLSNIEVRTRTEVVDGCGDGHLESVRLRTADGEMDERTSALFIFVGAEPKTDWLPASVLRDNKGFVLSGGDLRAAGNAFQWTLDRSPYLLETSVPGIFVAGDVRFGSVKRVASAVGQGSIAVQFVHQYLAKF